jgi:hypothetical protein
MNSLKIQHSKKIRQNKMMMKRLLTQRNHLFNTSSNRFTLQRVVKCYQSNDSSAPPSATTTTKPQKKDKKLFNPEQTQKILTSGISITVPPMHMNTTGTVPKKFGKQLTPDELKDLESEQFKARMKEAVGYVPEGYEFGKKPQSIEEFAERRKGEREKLETMLKQEDLDPETREAIKEVLELENMIRDYIKEENPEDPTDSSKEPRIPGIDYERFNSAGESKNEPLSNLASKYSGKSAGHGAPATWYQILGILLAACVASAVALGLARPGFERYISRPILNTFNFYKGGGEDKKDKE